MADENSVMDGGMQDDWTENLIVKYIGQKISKVRWRPSKYEQINGANRFVTGAWDNQVPLLSDGRGCCLGLCLTEALGYVATK